EVLRLDDGAVDLDHEDAVAVMRHVTQHLAQIGQSQHGEPKDGEGLSKVYPRDPPNVLSSGAAVVIFTPALCAIMSEEAVMVAGAESSKPRRSDGSHWVSTGASQSLSPGHDSRCDTGQHPKYAEW